MNGWVILPLILAGFYMKISFDCLRSSSAPAFQASDLRQRANMRKMMPMVAIALGLI